MAPELDAQPAGDGLGGVAAGHLRVVIEEHLRRRGDRRRDPRAADEALAAEAGASRAEQTGRRGREGRTDRRRLIQELMLPCRAQLGPEEVPPIWKVAAARAPSAVVNEFGSIDCSVSAVPPLSVKPSVLNMQIAEAEIRRDPRQRQHRRMQRVAGLAVGAIALAVEAAIVDAGRDERHHARALVALPAEARDAVHIPVRIDRLLAVGRALIGIGLREAAARHARLVARDIERDTGDDPVGDLIVRTDDEARAGLAVRRTRRGRRRIARKTVAARPGAPLMRHRRRTALRRHPTSAPLAEYPPARIGCRGSDPSWH